MASVLMSLALTSSAMAAKVKTSDCALTATVEKNIIKAFPHDKVMFTKVTPGQFHFLQGAYVSNPSTPAGLPPGDGAILATRDQSNNGVIIFTYGAKTCSSITIPAEFISMMDTIITQKLDSDGDEL
jgi:hypothetical protein